MGRNRTPAVVVDLTPVRVEISAGGNDIVLEAPGGLDAVAARAVQLWRDVRIIARSDPADTRESYTVGFAAVSEPVRSPLMAPEVELPYHLQPDAETPE